MEVVAEERVQDAQKRLNELLDLRRLCALVHPILHEAPAGGMRTPRRKRLVPTGDCVVRLFEGGGVTLAADEARKWVAGINNELVPRVRDVLEDTIASMSALTKGGGVDSLKALAGLLAAVGNANSFRLKSADAGEGRARIMPDNAAGAEIRFVGAKAQERADRFCMDVNAALQRHLAAVDKRMSTELAQVLDLL